MPRPPRIHDPERFAHITVHAVGSEQLFTLEWEALSFMRILGQVVVRNHLELSAYCLMSTHVHLLLRDPESNLPNAMRDLTGRYARWFNHRQGRHGPLFDGRYHRRPVEDDGHLLECVRYIALNPVAAGLCHRAADWRWSSHRALAGLIRPPDYLKTGFVLGMLGSSNKYVRFVEEGVSEERPAAPPPRRARGSRACGR
jgi:putative transposase